MALPIDDPLTSGAVAGAGRTFDAAIAARDAQAAAAAYSRTARLLAPSVEPIEGRAAIASFWRAGMDAGIRDVERVPVRVDLHGSVAVEIGRYVIEVLPADGQPVIDRGKYLVVHELQGDGSWQWAVEMFSPDGPPEGASALPSRHTEEVASG